MGSNECRWASTGWREGRRAAGGLGRALKLRKEDLERRHEELEEVPDHRRIAADEPNALAKRWLIMKMLLMNRR